MIVENERTKVCKGLNRACRVNRMLILALPIFRTMKIYISPQNGSRRKQMSK